MRQKYDPLKNSWAIVNGLPVHFWRSALSYPAESSTIIHLHGFAISGTYLLRAACNLASEYRTYVPDLPGFGRSVHPDKVLGMEELGQSVIDFMDEIGIASASLVGNSMGCITAIEAARLAPDRIDRMVLVSPAGGPNNRPIPRGIAQLALDGLREPPGIFRIAPPDYFRYGVVNAGRLFWSMIHYPTLERLRNVSKPTLIVLGKRDPLVNEKKIVEETLDVHQIAIVRIDGAAHAINFSHSQKLSHLTRQFLTGQLLTDDQGSAGKAVIIRQPFVPC